MQGSSLGQLSNQASRLFRRLADRRLEPLGLSAGQLPVFTALMMHEALSQKALVDHSMIEQPTMAATLSRMERDGIVLRRPDPQDRRSVLFSLTADARGKMDAVQAVVERINADAVRGLSDAQADRVRDTLSALIDALALALRDPM